MTQPTPPWRKDGTALAAFGLLEGVCSLGLLIFLLLTPSLPENALLLGLSPARLGIASLLLTATILSLAGSILIRRRRDFAAFQRTGQRRQLGLSLSVAAILLGALIVVIDATAAGSFPRLAIGRLAPLGGWLLVSGLALAAALFAGMPTPRKPRAIWFGLILAVFQAYWRAGVAVLGVVGSLLWLTNRWSLPISLSADVEFLALSFLVVSAVILADRPRLSLVLFGASLAIRHLAVGLVPIWLISTRRSARSWRGTLTDALLMAAVPVLTSLPLLLRNPNALVRSLLNAVGAPDLGK